MSKKTETPHDEIGAFIPVDHAGLGHSHWLKERHKSIKTKSDQVVAVSFGKKKLQALLKTSGAMGIRFYFSKSVNEIDGKNVEHDDILGIAFDKDGNDILSGGDFKKHRKENSAPIDHTNAQHRLLMAAAPTGTAEVLNSSLPCPKFCNG